MTQPSGTATFTSHSATTKIVMELDIVFIPVATEDGRGGNGANGHCLEKSFESVWGEKITEIWASFFLRTSFWNASFCMEWLKLPKYDRNHPGYRAICHSQWLSKDSSIQVTDITPRTVLQNTEKQAEDHCKKVLFYLLVFLNPQRIISVTK